MTSETTGPPRDFEALKELLLARHDSLPRRLAQVAAFALENPDEIAFGTVASVAQQADVQPSTLIRFAQQLGFAGFSDLQEVFRQQLRSRWPDYRERLARLKVDGPQASGGGAAALLAGFVESATVSLERLGDTVSAEEVERAADILAGADTIFLLGLRRAFPVAAYLAYALGKLGLRAVLVDHVAALAPEQIGGARPGDAVVAISFSPYTPTTIELAARAAEIGVPVVAITDSPFSPLRPSATVQFEVAEADFSAFRSLSATLALAMALAVATGARRGGG
jgi:DNA-binding MurR/RpiR family transcriptional regulator